MAQQKSLKTCAFDVCAEIGPNTPRLSGFVRGDGQISTSPPARHTYLGGFTFLVESWLYMGALLGNFSERDIFFPQSDGYNGKDRKAGMKDLYGNKNRALSVFLGRGSSVVISAMQRS